MLSTESIVASIIIFFVLGGALYDVEFSQESKRIHTRKFRWKRLGNWFPLGVAYAAFYMARYNVAAGNIASIRNQFNFTEVDMGWVLSAGSWSYAFSAPLTGRLADHLGGCKSMVISCLGSSLCNLLLGILFLMQNHSSVPSTYLHSAFLILYACNIAIQGFGTSAVVKINAAWYQSQERGLFSGVFNILLTSGYYLALGSGSSIISSLGWHWIFLIPGFTLLVMGIVIHFVVKDKPCKLLPGHLEFNLLDSKDTSRSTKQDSSTSVGVLLCYGPFLSYLGAVFSLCWVRDGLLNWLYSYLDFVRGESLSPDFTAILGGAWTIGGFVGGLLCGWISDVLFKGQRGQPLCLFSLLQIVALYLFYQFSQSSSLVVGGLLVFTSIAILGNYTVLSYTIPSDLPANVAATAAGVMTATGYLSTGLSGVFMGSLIQRFGYQLWIISLIVASLCGAIFSALGSYLTKKHTLIPPTPKAYAGTPLLDTPNGRRKRRSIVNLSSDFLLSPVPICRPES